VPEASGQSHADQRDFEGKMKLAKGGGSGTVTMRTCGDRSALDLSGQIDVKAS
jgi:hypothetical protein